MTTSRYTPSGRMPAHAVPIVLLLALAAVPIAWAYAWLIRHAPVILNPLIAFGVTLCLGVLVKTMAKRGRIRSQAWIGRIGMATGLLGWYCQWAAWSALVLEAGGVPAVDAFIGMASHPWALVEFAIDVAGAGTSHLGGWRLNGIVLVGIWLVELWWFLAFPKTLGRMQVEEPFCEATGTWARKTEVKQRFAVFGDPDAARARFESDPAALRWLLRPVAEGGEDGYAEVELYRCDGGSSYLSVRNVALEPADKGEPKKTVSAVTTYLALPGIDADDLVRRWAGSVPAAGAGSTPADPPELAPAIDHVRAERYAQALAAAQPFAGAAGHALRADANRVCSLACSRLGDWRAAVRHWQALFDHEPTAHNALQLASSSVMAGDLAGGTAWYEQAQAMSRVFRDMPGSAILTNFVTALTQSGHTRAALPYLDEIRRLYAELEITDPTFLRLRGVPFFSAFLDNSWPIVEAEMDAETGRAWYAALAGQLDAAGQADLEAWMENRFGAVTS